MTDNVDAAFSPPKNIPTTLSQEKQTLKSQNFLFSNILILQLPMNDRERERER